MKRVSDLNTIFDQPLAADSFNVVLVDGADTKSPTVQTLLVDSRLTGDGDALTRAIRNTPDLLNFIQCDTGAPQPARGGDPRTRAMLAMATTFCRQLR
ncbi:MAG TPA: hypothetical protein VHZ73_00975 [Vicinamibacterales bacterium]|jgi:hypothetical protein|nr:hypothetical protein [Vicinamibacterales bacterium]